MAHLLLVTGAAGFVGSRFVQSCSQLGIPVISVDHIHYFDLRTEHRAVPYGLKIERDQLFSWLKDQSPKITAIVHLGACTETTQLNVEYLKKVNFQYSRDLWTYASEHSIPMVYASSAATYGNGAMGYDDDETLMPQLRPLNPYGRSKLDFDLWALAEEKKGHHPPSWSGFKFFNVYGFGERHKNKMSSVVLQAYDQVRNGGKVRLFKSCREDIADGLQMRDFVYISDVIDILYFALNKPILRGIYNLGTGQARSFLDLARATFAAMGHPETIEYIEMPSEIREQYQYYTEAKMVRLRAEGYKKSFTTLENGIKEYVKELLGNKT